MAKIIQFKSNQSPPYGKGDKKPSDTRYSVVDYLREVLANSLYKENERSIDIWVDNEVDLFVFAVIHELRILFINSGYDVKQDKNLITVRHLDQSKITPYDMALMFGLLDTQYNPNGIERLLVPFISYSRFSMENLHKAEQELLKNPAYLYLFSNNSRSHPRLLEYINVNVDPDYVPFGEIK